MTAPQVLGKYQLRRAIGHGAMGHVYEAWDPELQRAVAIKLLTRELTDDAQERFRREARAIAALDHANIVRIYDLGYHDSSPFIVMQLLVGHNLADEIAARTARTLEDKVRLAGDLCLALHAAHSAGIIHRDIKPANIHLGQDGVVRLVDFGIAHLMGSVLTLPADVLGTPAYLAPEVLSGHVLDGRADVYSLAATTYEWIAGCRPFVAPDIPSLFERILHGVPAPLNQHCPECSPALASTIQSALSKDVSSRPVDALAFRRDLLAAVRQSTTDERRALDATTVVVKRVSRPHVTRRALVIASVVLVGVAVTANYAGRWAVVAERPTSSPSVGALAEGTPDTAAPVTAGPAKSSGLPAPPSSSQRQPNGATRRAAEASEESPVSPPPPVETDAPEPDALPIGTPLVVAIIGELRTDRNRVGDSFAGELRAPLMIGPREVVPAGSAVAGRVEAVSASGGLLPFLELSLTALQVGPAQIPIRTARYRVDPPDAQGTSRLLPLILGAAAGGIVGGMVAGREGVATGAAAGGALSGTGTPKSVPATYVLGNRLTFKLAQAAEIGKQD